MKNSNILITFASWEDRFRIGFDRNLKKVGVRKALMFYFGSYADRTLANRQAVDEVCKEKSIELIPVKIDIEKPAEQLENSTGIHRKNYCRMPKYFN